MACSTRSPSCDGSRGCAVRACCISCGDGIGRPDSDGRRTRAPPRTADRHRSYARLGARPGGRPAAGARCGARSSRARAMALGVLDEQALRSSGSSPSVSTTRPTERSATSQGTRRPRCPHPRASPAAPSRRRQACAVVWIPARPPADEELPRRPDRGPRQALRNLYLTEKEGETSSTSRTKRPSSCSPTGRRSRSRTPAATRPRGTTRGARAPRQHIRREHRDRACARGWYRPRPILELVVSAGARSPMRARRWCCSNRATSWWSPRWRASSTTRSSAIRFPSRRPSPARCSAPERPSVWPTSLDACGSRSPSRRTRRAALRAAARARPLVGRPCRVRPPSRRPRFSAWDEQVLSGFAASAASAVASARDTAAQMLRRSIESAEQERGRWARELHDETLQELPGSSSPSVPCGAPTAMRRAARPRDCRRTNRLRDPRAAADHRRPARGPRRPWPRAGARDAGGACGRPHHPSFGSSW